MKGSLTQTLISVMGTKSSSSKVLWYLWLLILQYSTNQRDIFSIILFSQVLRSKAGVIPLVYITCIIQNTDTAISKDASLNVNLFPVTEDGNTRRISDDFQNMDEDKLLLLSFTVYRQVTTVKLA